VATEIRLVFVQGSRLARARAHVRVGPVQIVLDEEVPAGRGTRGDERLAGFRSGCRGRCGRGWGRCRTPGQANQANCRENPTGRSGNSDAKGRKSVKAGNSAENYQSVSTLRRGEGL